MIKKRRPCDCTGYSKRHTTSHLTAIPPTAYDRWVFFSKESVNGWLNYARETSIYNPENTLPKKVVASDHLRLDKELENFRSVACFSGATHLEAEQFLVARLVCLMKGGVDVWTLEV